MSAGNTAEQRRTSWRQQSFQLNHYENSITPSQTQAGDNVSVLPLDNRADAACPSRWEMSPLRACAHVVGQKHTNTLIVNTIISIHDTHTAGWGNQSCTLIEIILAFFQTHTVPPIRFIFLWNNSKNMKLLMLRGIDSLDLWPRSGFYKQELTAA